MKDKLALLTLSLILTSCTSYEIKDSVVSDRVKACSAGFSEDLRAQLHASLSKMDTSGALEGDIKEETKALIFAETPTEQHLQVYEEYIKCVEQNWNVDKIYPWDPRKPKQPKKVK